jgi:hypothetical protein
MPPSTRQPRPPRLAQAALLLAALAPAACTSPIDHEFGQAMVYTMLAFIDPGEARRYADEQGMKTTTISVTVSGKPDGYRWPDGPGSPDPHASD